MASKTESREDRVADYVRRLTDFTVSAEAVKDAPKPVADFTKAIGKLTGYVDSMNGDASAVVEALVLKGHAEVWQDTLDNLRLIASTLTGGASEGPDRSEGDALAKKLSALVEADLVEEDDASTFTSLVTRWQASAPKGSKSSGSKSGTRTAVKQLGFTVHVKCDKCEWSTSSTADNLNSVRDLALNKHARKVHGFDGSDGTRAAGLTEALAAVGMTSSKFEVGSSTQTQGGGFLVTRR